MRVAVLSFELVVKCNSPSSTFKPEKSAARLKSCRHYTIVLRREKVRKHEINLNIFKRQKHRFMLQLNVFQSIDVCCSRNVIFFNLKLFFCLLPKLFSFFFGNKLEFQIIFKKKQNFSLVVLLFKHSRKTHKISSKLCCATKKKLIRRSREEKRRNQAGKQHQLSECLSFPLALVTISH